MPATFPTESFFLEAHFFGDEDAELRMPCATVVLEAKSLLVRGMDARHLAALNWTPDALSFRSQDKNHWYPVGRPVVVDSLSARFPLR